MKLKHRLGNFSPSNIAPATDIVNNERSVTSGLVGATSTAGKAIA